MQKSQKWTVVARRIVFLFTCCVGLLLRYEMFLHIFVFVFDLRSDYASIRIRNTHSWRLIKPLRLMVPTFWPKGIPPHNITLYKGCNQVALTRAFVVFFLFSRQSRDLVEWLADTMIPDEYIWPTLNHNPHLHAPGSYKGTRVVTLYKVRLNSATCIR